MVTKSATNRSKKSRNTNKARKTTPADAKGGGDGTSTAKPRRASSRSTKDVAGSATKVATLQSLDGVSAPVNTDAGTALAMPVSSNQSEDFDLCTICEYIGEATSQAANLTKLEIYTDKIHRCRHIGNVADAIMAATLLQARAEFKKNRKSKNGDDGLSFTQWYQDEFKLSIDKATRLMRWVKPVLKRVDWNNPDDPILRELVSLGSCLCTEAYKLGEDRCYFDNDGGLVFKDPTQDEAIVPVSTLNVLAMQAKVESIELFLAPAVTNALPAPAGNTASVPSGDDSEVEGTNETDAQPGESEAIDVTHRASEQETTEQAESTSTETDSLESMIKTGSARSLRNRKTVCPHSR